MSEQAAGGDELPFRYGPRLAAGIERRWQERWAAEGTFYTPNPAGPLSDGFEPGREPFYGGAADHRGPGPDRQRGGPLNSYVTKRVEAASYIARGFITGGIAKGTNMLTQRKRR